MMKVLMMKEVEVGHLHQDAGVHQALVTVQDTLCHQIHQF